MPRRFFSCTWQSLRLLASEHKCVNVTKKVRSLGSWDTTKYLNVCQTRACTPEQQPSTMISKIHCRVDGGWICHLPASHGIGLRIHGWAPAQDVFDAVLQGCDFAPGSLGRLEINLSIGGGKSRREW